MSRSTRFAMPALAVAAFALPPAQAAASSHGGGAMRARVVDFPHADNVGAFVVTAVWTPL